MRLKRSLGLISAVAARRHSGGLRLLELVPTATDGGSAARPRSGTATSPASRTASTITPVKAGTLTVETTLPAQGWWNGTTPDTIKDGYEYCMAAELANMAGLSSVTVKNVSFDQLVAGHTNDFDLALAEISITPERAKVVDFSKPYFDSNIGVLTKKGADVTEDNIQSKRCAAYAGTTSVPFIQDQLKCSSTKIYPNSTTLYQSVLSGPVRRGLPGHRDRARRGQGRPTVSSRSRASTRPVRSTAPSTPRARPTRPASTRASGPC